MIKKKVLIIDDSPLIREMTKDILEEEGYVVHTASNGIEANHHIYSSVDSKPDLIILDVMMPLLSGDKSAKMLKETDYCKDIPILFISSKDEPELMKLVMESNANGFLCKPFTKHKLIGSVRNYI